MLETFELILNISTFVLLKYKFRLSLVDKLLVNIYSDKLIKKKLPITKSISNKHSSD